ncbi:M48 family metallopeptidase [Limnoglobus roseus]|uniref:Protease HtpX n=1 Tax=Limnoglobus roseus TaxID=2598579 RepID=A0A5C1ALH4_9BACT|nr:M48 family metallopeptidase [Limnoglobus roseus]QEL19800.1 Protease HtpX [Limnoglobus roseus]
MPIILVLLLTASCARLPWPEPPFGVGGSGSLALTAFAFLLPIGGAIVLSRWVASSVRAEPSRRGEIASQYSRYRRFLGYVNLVVAVLAVVGLGWGWTVWNRIIFPTDHRVVAPLAELLVPAPYLFTVFTSWLVYYDVERLFHSTGRSESSFWSRTGYFFFNLRPFAFLVLLPVVLFAAQQTFVRLAPEAAESWVAQLLGFAMVPLLFVFLPVLLRPALGLKPMPDDPTRERLEELARKMNFRYSNLLVWSTRGAMANAMVVGVVPWARYVVFTDRLIDAMAPDELDAVFGHEVGHAKHWHIPYYALFFMLSVPAVAAVVSVLFDQVAASGFIDAKAWEPWVGLPPLAGLLAYIFLVFGYLSRKCERQADIYGCRVASGGERVDVNGIDAMMRALTRVADLNGMDARTGTPEHQSVWKRLWALFRSWQHGSIGERVHFLANLMENPEIERGIQWRVYLLRWGLLLGLIAVIAGVVAITGWKEIARAM